MNEVVGWMWVILLLALPVAMIGTVLWWAFAPQPLEKKYGSNGGLVGGGLAGFDAAFSPTGHEAGIERDRQTKRTAPAPAPGDPPWTIDGDSIRIDV